MSIEASACARTSLPGGDKDRGQVRRSAGKRVVEALTAERGPTVADLAYREVHAMSRTKATLRLVTAYHPTRSVRFAARCAAWASAQISHTTAVPDPTSESLASTTSLQAT
jgi:hypothetical protein